MCTPTSQWPFLRRLQRQRIVKILGIHGVNGEGRHVPEITTAFELFCRDCVRNRIGRGEHVIGKFIRQSVLREDGVHLDFMIARLAQNLHHPSRRGIARIVPTHHLDDDLLAIFSALQMLRSDEKVRVQPLVRRIAKRIIPDSFQHHHVLLALPLNDARHPRRVLPTAPQPIHFHRIAPKRRARVAFRNGDFIPVRHHHKATAVPCDLNRANGAVVLLHLCQDKFATADGFQPTVAAHFLEHHRNLPAHVMVQNPQRTGHLFVVERLVGLAFENL